MALKYSVPDVRFPSLKYDYDRNITAVIRLQISSLWINQNGDYPGWVFRWYLKRKWTLTKLSPYYLEKANCYVVNSPKSKLPHWASLVAQTVKHLSAMQETRFPSLGWEDPLEKEMVAHSNILAWKIPWTAEPGRLMSMGFQRVGHDWAISLQRNCRWFLGAKNRLWPTARMEMRTSLTHHKEMKSANN